MKRIIYAATLVVAVLAFTSCSTAKPLYTWHNYEDVTYKYSKRTTDELRAKVLEQYEKLCQVQRGERGVVPPGLYAEYGFLLYKTGKKEEGIAYLKKEVALYPESEVYISRIIKQLEK